ncbi:unnamed protein product [Cuscuta epithymum]|uniref:Uncharacterized protein n=1 Tax=Cuscuta epithymum TaxID=186058 RepID=A0AAV0BYJ7_9ASTE|nr:unnamed protein product [Cuscuta epithymum]
MVAFVMTPLPTFICRSSPPSGFLTPNRWLLLISKAAPALVCWVFIICWVGFGIIGPALVCWNYGNNYAGGYRLWCKRNSTLGGGIFAGAMEKWILICWEI